MVARAVYLKDVNNVIYTVAALGWENNWNGHLDYPYAANLVDVLDVNLMPNPARAEITTTVGAVVDNLEYVGALLILR